MAQSARDRRPMFGGSSVGGNKHDVESLEQENDHAFDAMGDKVSMLKKMTANIKQEVNSQHDALSGLSDAIGGAQIGLAAASARFKKVFDDPRRNRTFMLAGGAIVIIFGIYLIVTHL